MIRKPREAVDLMMWVGTSYYPTIEDFIEEAEEMDVSKRVGHPPVNIRLGSSLLFLAHDEGHRKDCAKCRGTGIRGGVSVVELMLKSARGLQPDNGTRQTVRSKRAFQQLQKATSKQTRRRKTWRAVKGQTKCKECGGLGRVSTGSIFGFCKIARVELLFDRKGAVNEFLERQPRSRSRSVEVTPVVGQELKEVRRGCGYRQIGAYYLIGEKLDLITEHEEIAEQLGVKWKLRNPIVVFDPPVPYTGQRFRGTKAVNRTDIFKKLKLKRPKRAKRRHKRRSAPRNTAARSRRSVSTR